MKNLVIKLIFFFIICSQVVHSILAQTNLDKSSKLNVVVDLDSLSFDLDSIDRDALFNYGISTYPGIKGNQIIDSTYLFSKAIFSSNVNLIFLSKNEKDEIVTSLKYVNPNLVIDNLTILDKSCFKDGKIDTKKIKNEINDSFVLISKNPVTEKVTQFKLPEAYLEFNSIDKISKDKRERFKKLIDALPENENDYWFAENKDKLLIYLNFIQKTKGKNFINKLDLSKKSIERMIIMGAALDESTFDAEFKKTDSTYKISRCKLSLKKLGIRSEKIEIAPNELCKEIIDTKTEFKFNPFGCSKFYYDKANNQWLQSESLKPKQCMNDPKIKYNFLGINKNICVAHIGNQIISAIDKNRCQSDTNKYIYCLPETNIFTMGVEKVLENEAVKLIPHLLISDERIKNYFNDDKIEIARFVQSVFDETLLPCLINNNSGTKTCFDKLKSEVDLRLKDLKNERELIELLKKDLNKNIIETKRDIEVFHWSKNKEMLKPTKFKGNNDTKAYNYAKMLINYGTSGNSSADVVGAGLYLASDPFGSNHFGDYGVKIRIPQKEKLLDIRLTENKIEISKETARKIVKSCPNYSYIHHMKQCIEYIKNCFIDKDVLFSESCGQIAKKAFRESGIRGLIYNYNLNQLKLFCDSSFSNQAFLYLDQNLDPKNVSLFSKDDPYYKFVDHLFKNDPTVFKRSNEFDEKVKKYLEDNKEFATQYREKTFGCDFKKYPEDKPKTK